MLCSPILSKVSKTRGLSFPDLYPRFWLQLSAEQIDGTAVVQAA